VAGSGVGSAGEGVSTGLGVGLGVAVEAGVRLGLGDGATVGLGTSSGLPTLQAAIDVAMARRAKSRLGRFIGRLQGGLASQA
jgi:hypothetical protein